jgi:endonuclease G
MLAHHGQAASSFRVARTLMAEGIMASKPKKKVTPKLPFTIAYDPSFLGDGIVVPLPKLTDEIAESAYDGGKVFDYIHYSLVMNQDRQLAFFTATNIDGESIVRITRRKVPWTLDPRIPKEVQTDNWEGYAGTAFDHGHLTRREDVNWESALTADTADAATFFLTNSAPQHMNFNQDEWLELENWALDLAKKDQYRVCVGCGSLCVAASA